MSRLFITAIVLLWIAACGDRPGAVKPPLQPAEVGNGGHGVKKKDGKVYLYDFWEIGIEEKVSISVPKEESFSRRVRSYRDRLAKSLAKEDFPIDALAVKIADMDSVDSYFTNTLLYAIELYSWSVVPTTFELLPIEGKIMRADDVESLLVANRRGRNIYISAPAFAAMNVANQVGTMIHEAVFSLLPPRSVALGGTAVVKQDSVRTRLITGLFFREDLSGKLAGGGLGNYIGTAELPFLPAKWALSPRDAASATHGVRYASSYFLLQNSKYRPMLPENVDGVIGTAYVEVPSQVGLNGRMLFDVYDSQLSQKMDVVCLEWAQGHSKRLDINLLFQGRNMQEEIVELQFKQYQERGQVKDYIEHRRTNNTVRIPVSEFNRHYNPYRVAEEIALLANFAHSLVMPRKGTASRAPNQELEQKRKAVCLEVLGKTIPETLDLAYPHREELFHPCTLPGSEGLKF